MTFLSGKQFRPLVIQRISGSETLGLVRGQVQAPLEVVVVKSATQPAVTAMRMAWKDRHGGRAAPVLLVVIYGNRAAICGPSEVFGFSGLFCVPLSLTVYREELVRKFPLVGFGLTFSDSVSEVSVAEHKHLCAQGQV